MGNYTDLGTLISKSNYSSPWLSEQERGTESELLDPAEVRLPCGTCAICEVRTLHPKIPVCLRENVPERDYSLCGQTQALETASIQYKIGMAEGDHCERVESELYFTQDQGDEETRFHAAHPRSLLVLPLRVFARLWCHG